MPKKMALHPGDFRTPPEMSLPLMTPSEAARRLGVNPAIVRGWVDKGLLRPRVVAKSGRYHFTEQQIFGYRHDDEVREVLREIDRVETNRYIPGREIKPIKRPRLKQPIPGFMPSSLAAKLLCVSVDTLKLWRRRKAFPPLVVLPTGQSRYSKFQIMAFSPEAVRRVAQERLRHTAPGYEKHMRSLQETLNRIWRASPVMQELCPRKGTPEPPFTH